MKNKKTKNKLKVEKIQAMIGKCPDYHFYNMTITDQLIAFALGAVVAAVVSWIFFKLIFLTIILSVIAGIYAQPMYMEYKINKRKKELLLSFRDLLESLTASYAAGKNTLDAFSDAETDLVHIYGEESDIVVETKAIITGIHNGVNAEELLTNFALRSGLDDINNFANVFRVALRQGANISEIIAITRDVINDKIEVEMEINTIMAGNKNELNIMMVMPLVILVSLGNMGMADGNGGFSFSDFAVKVVALLIFIAAYFLGKKFTKIDL